MGNTNSSQLAENGHPFDENTLRLERLQSALKRTETFDKVGNWFFSVWKSCLSGCTRTGSILVSKTFL